MSILFILVAIAFTVTTTILMLRPFSASRREQLSFELLDEEERKIEALVSRKVALVQALRDIEYDWETNKISKEDYQRFKKSCERQAVGVMRKLDALHGGERDWEAEIDRAVKQRRQENPDPTVEPTPNTTSPPEATPPSNDSEQPPVTQCRSCGVSLAPDDQFCSQCGTPTDASGGEGPTPNPADDLDNLSTSSTSEVAG